MKNKILIFLGVLILGSCVTPKDALFALMSNIEMSEAIYESSNNELDTLQMGFDFHKPPIDLGTNKPFRVLTKEFEKDLEKYELRSIQFDSLSSMEHVELVRKDGKSGKIKLTEHNGTLKTFQIGGKEIRVYKQSYNRDENPKNNYSEFFTTQHGLIMIADNQIAKELVKYKGLALSLEFEALKKRIKSDSTFFETDTITIFETWEEVY